MQLSFGYWKKTSSFVFATAILFSSASAADLPSGLVEKGTQQWAENNLDGAQKSFEQAANQSPKSVEANFKLAGLLLSRNDFTGSIRTYQRVIGLDPKHTKAWLGLGISYMHTGNNELSVAAFEEAIRLDPGRKKQLDPILINLKKD